MIKYYVKMVCMTLEYSQHELVEKDRKREEETGSASLEKHENGRNEIKHREKDKKRCIIYIYTHTPQINTMERAHDVHFL